MKDPIVSFLEERLDDYLDDLRTLVNIDSGSHEKKGIDAVDDWLEDRLTKLGFSIERQHQVDAGDDLLATLQGRGKVQVMLLGHSDTVFPSGTASQRPMRIEADKILGPGTCDMKAGLLNGLYALEALRATGFEDFKRITYLCVSDEEAGDRHSPPLIRATSRHADAVLTLEAARSTGEIVTARKGVRWYTIEAFGRAAHAGVEPEMGQNAILTLAYHVVALNRLTGLRDGVTVNTGYIEGGLVPNMVADYAKMRIDVRAFCEEDFQAFEAAMQIELANTPVPKVRTTTMLEESSALIPMPRTTAIEALEKLAQQSAQELGFIVHGTSTGGASDANIVAGERVPVLDGLGPIGGLDHSPDEYIILSSIVPRTALLAKLILAIARKQKE